MSCASITRTRNPKIDMLKLGGRRPAIEWPHCTAIAKKIDISVLLCIGACHLAGDAKMNMFELIGRRSAMKSSLFSYAIEKKKLYILMFCASLHHIRNPTIDVLKLAGRRPAMNQTHCAAMLKQQLCLCVAVARSPLWRETFWNWWFRDRWQMSSPETLASWLH